MVGIKANIRVYAVCVRSKLISEFYVRSWADLVTFGQSQAV